MSLISLTEGSVFAGRYRIVRSIAQGGMGAVYEVVHTETQRRRALKVMLANMLQSQDMRDRFRQEACVTAQIESEYIVDVLDAGIDDKTQMPFLVMELLRGEELDKRLQRLGRLDPREVVTYLNHVAIALDKTHRASIVHRDLKPANVFLTEREDGSLRAKILDFGVAKLVAEGATSAAATQSLGTPLYMAPEQFNIGQKVSPAVDIFSLGMMAYTLLVGAPYWQEEVSGGANIYAFAARAMHGPSEAATARAMRQGALLPAAFDAWFARVTAASPQARFATASSAVASLAEALGVALLGSERASSLPAAPPISPHAVAPRASSPFLNPPTPGSLNPPTPESLGVRASGSARLADAGTMPLREAPLSTELPSHTAPLPVAGLSSPPVERGLSQGHVTANGMAATAAVKGSPRKPVIIMLGTAALSLVVFAGVAAVLLRGGAAPPALQGPEEVKSGADLLVAEAARPRPASTSPEPSVSPLEAAQQPSSLPALAQSQEPAPTAAGSISPVASPSAAPSAAPSAGTGNASGLGKGTKAPSSGAATGPGAGSKNTAEDLKRD